MIKHLRLLLGLILSVLALVAITQTVDINQAATALRDVDYLWLLPAIAIGPLSVWFKAMRWRVLFLPRTGLRTAKLFDILAIGYLINTVFPARLGDPARAFLASDLEGVPAANALSTIVAERLLDLLTLLVFLVLLMPYINLPDWLSYPAVVVGAAASLGFVALVAIGRKRDRLTPLIERVARRLPRLNPETVTRQVEHLLSGFDAFNSRSACAAIAGWSVVVWVLAAVQNAFVLVAFHSPAPFSAAALVLIVNALGMLIPSSPGYVGVFHYLTVLTLAIYGVAAGLALSYAVVLHLAIFLPLVLLGLAATWRESLSLGKVSARAARLEG
ncbi:MAG: lysylphosphatidylglycerol synthase transmembrane domain-containing protein [Chloroflexota bacterium]